jgi:hypothetical protein
MLHISFLRFQFYPDFIQSENESESFFYSHDPCESTKTLRLSSSFWPCITQRVTIHPCALLPLAYPFFACWLRQ